MLEFHKEVFKNKKKSSMELFHRGGWGEAKNPYFLYFLYGGGGGNGQKPHFFYFFGWGAKGKYPYFLYILKAKKENSHIY